MANLNLPNVREGGDIRFRIGLEDNGVAVDWSGLEGIRVFLYADAQKQVSGECTIEVDAEDNTVLACLYSGDDPQFRGINSVLVRAKYQGEIKVYDKPAINIVARTADADGVLVIDDPVVPVQINVEEVSTSLLNNAIDAAINAAAEAEKAIEDVRDEETAFQAAEAARVLAEQGRVSAEQSRVAQASADHTLAGQDHTRAESDHGTASDDHTLAVSDHGVASGDHTTALVDHSLAESDHTRAESDHGVAGSDHTIAQGDHTQAGSDHSTAVADHTQAGADHTVAGQDHTQAGTDHNTAASDHTQAGLDHTQAGEDHTQALADHQVMAGYDNRLDAVEGEVDQLEAEVHNLNIAVEIDSQTNALSYSSDDDSPNTINTSTNKWETQPADYNYMMLPVIPGAKYTITTRSNRNCKATMLAEDIGAVGDDVVFATGWSEVQTLSMNTTTVWEAPANAKYLYIQRVNNAITVSPSSITERAVTSVIQTLKEEIDGLVEGKDTILQPVNFADYFVFDYGLNTSTLKWGTNASYKHTLIPVPADAKTVIAKAASSGGIRIAWLDNMTSNSSGADASITAGTTVTTTDAGEEVTIQVPTEAKYMYVYLGQLTDGIYPFQPSYLALSAELVANNNYGGFTEKQATSTDELMDIVSLVGSDIDLDSLTRYKCYVSASNTWTAVTYGKHIYVPVNPGDTVFIRPKKNCYSTFAFTTSVQSPTANGGAVDVIPGATNTHIIGGNTARVIVPSGAKYICFTTGDTRYVFGIEGRTPERVTVCPSVLAPDDIVSLNPDSEFIPKIMSARKRYYTSTDTTEPTPLVIAHLSDIHGNWDNVARFLKFTEHHSSNIDLLLNTGDTVSSYYTDGIAGYSALDGAEKIMNVIGNHDTRGNSAGMAQWTDHIGTDAYNLLIKPFVSEWDVVQPEDAETNGYCYYYKDFATKKIRLVVVDIMAYDETENTWLASVLADASEGGLSVVIATHYAGVRSSAEQAEAVFTKVPCNYTTLYSLGGDSTNLTGYNTYAYKMMETVDAFMQGGGEFVGYIQGHYHADFVAKCAEYPSQLIFSIGASKAGEFRDYNHIVGTRDQDEFQIISIDPVNTIVKLYKVGANYDRYGRKKGSVCVDYTTGQVLGEGW